MEQILSRIASIVWGPFLILLLLGTGLLYTFKLRFIQVRKFIHGLKATLGFYDQPEHKGHISHFQALCTALSATIGVGNIAGVATAIAIGGPGAVFWMWVTGFLGMVIKFASCTLGHKFRIKREGGFRGGPMYYIEKGLKMRGLAIFFAFCCAIAAFGIGNMVQSNSVADAIETNFKIPPSLTGITIAIFTWLVIVGGIKRIAKFAQAVVPFMCLFYISCALFAIFSNFQATMLAFEEIFKRAFTPLAFGSGMAGGTLLLTIRIGIARGLFSNEAGLGSAPIAHAAAKTDEPVREGFVAMLGPFVDTLLVCSMTALVILVSGLWQEGLTGAELTSRAFEKLIPGLGGFMVAIGIIFFAFSTLIGWSYYGEVAIDYLFGLHSVKIYRWLYCLVIPLGAIMKLEIVWTLSDIANGLMAFPNLLALFALRNVVKEELTIYLEKFK